MSRETIKYLAIVAMTMNHIAGGLMPEGILREAMQDIGYFTAVVMCFFLAEGFRYTSSKKRYRARLFAFGMISQFPFYFAFRVSVLNMMVTLFLSFLLLEVAEEKRFEGKRTVLGILLVFASGICDWPIMAPLFTLLFYQAGENRQERKRACGSVMILYVMFTFISYTALYGGFGALVYTLFASIGPAAACLVILFAYNGKEGAKGRGSKWFFYLYYPAHLLVIGLIRLKLGI